MNHGLKWNPIMHPNYKSQCPGPRIGSWMKITTLVGFTSLALLFAFIPVSGVRATIYAQQLKLEGLCSNADRIFRGTVMDITRGEIKVGGGTLSTVTYHLKVKENIAGEKVENIPFTMIADPKAPVQQGNHRRLPMMELPELVQGKEYLLFTTKPSKIGLSSPVGLALGCFTIWSKEGKDYVVNGANNVGLGPMPLRNRKRGMV